MYTRPKMCIKMGEYTFSILSDTSKLCIIQNPRVSHVEGVLVHTTHPVCMIVCTGEAQCYACHIYNAKMKQRVKNLSTISCCYKQKGKG